MDARYQLTGRHPGHRWPYGSACAWWILLTSPGSYSHVSLGVESFHIIARYDCTCSHTSVFDAVRVKYRKGMYSVTIITSVPWHMERVLRSWLCYELHSSVTFFEEIWDVATKPYIARHPAHFGGLWQASHRLACCRRVIGSFFSTACTKWMDTAYQWTCSFTAWL